MGVAERVKVKAVEVLADDWSVLKKTIFAFRRRDGTWQEQARETYDRGDGAAMLLYDPERRTVILTRQFRYPTFVNGYDDLMIEVPAGRLDEASPEARIRAEVEEESGYRVGHMEKVFEAYMSPGSVTEKLFFFLGRYEPKDRGGDGGGDPEEGEDIDVMELPFDRALMMIGSGEIRDAKTIMLLQHAALTVFAENSARSVETV